MGLKSQDGSRIQTVLPMDKLELIAVRMFPTAGRAYYCLGVTQTRNWRLLKQMNNTEFLLQNRHDLSFETK